MYATNEANTLDWEGNMVEESQMTNYAKMSEVESPIVDDIITQCDNDLDDVSICC